MVLRSPPLPNFLTLSDLPPLMRLLITLNISIFINFPLLESDHNSSHHLDEFMNRYNLLNHVNRENYDYILPHTKNLRSCYKRVLRIMKSFSGIYDCFRIRSLNVMSCVVLFSANEIDTFVISLFDVFGSRMLMNAIKRSDMWYMADEGETNESNWRNLFLRYFDWVGHHHYHQNDALINRH